MIHWKGVGGFEEYVGGHTQTCVSCGSKYIVVVYVRHLGVLCALWREERTCLV